MRLWNGIAIIHDRRIGGRAHPAAVQRWFVAKPLCGVRVQELECPSFEATADGVNVTDVPQ
jgi:hypothetical protein